MNIKAKLAPALLTLTLGERLVCHGAAHGSWSWYTASAGWRYRLLVESLPGLRPEDAKLRFAPVR